MPNSGLQGRSLAALERRLTWQKIPAFMQGLTVLENRSSSLILQYQPKISTRTWRPIFLGGQIKKNILTIEM